MAPWNASRTTCCARSRSEGCGSSASGSPTCSASSSPSPSPRPSSRTPSRRACTSTARPSTASAACRRATCSPGPTPTRFELLPWAERDDAVGPHVLRHPQPRRHARSRATPARCSSATSTRPASRASRSTSPPRWSSSTSPTATRRTPPQPLDTGVLLRPHHRRRRQRPAQAHHPHARGHGHPRRVLVPRGRPQPARDRPALHRRPVDGRQRHDLPPRRARDRRSSRACYATFMPKPLAGVQGSGMHTHLSLFEGDTNAFHDPGDPYGLSKVGPRLHRRRCSSTPRRSPPSPTSW